MNNTRTDTPPNYLLLVLQRWQIVAVCALAGALFAGVLALMRPDSYVSTAIVVVTPPPFQESTAAPRVEADGALLQISGLVPATPPLESLKQLAESPALLADVVAAADLDTTARDLDERTEVRLTTVLENQRGTDPFSPALIFNVEARDAEEAAKTLQQWMETFKARVDEMKLAKLDETYRLIHEMWTEADTNLAEAENALEDFQKEWNVPLLRQRLQEKEIVFTQLEKDLDDLALDIADKRGAVNELRKRLGDEPMKTALFKAPPEEVYWARKERGDSAADAGKLGLEHEMINPTHSHIAQLLADERTALAALEAERAASEEKLAALDTELRELQSTIATQGLVESRLERDANSFSRVLNLASGIRGNVELARLIRASDIFIPSRAPQPQTPAEKSIPAFLILGLLVGALIGIAYIVVESLLNDARPVPTT